MPKAQANGIEIEYEEMGAGEPLVLVMGIGAQLVLWPDGFCAMLADRGFRVLRFDNRDVGLSTKFTAAGTPKPMDTLARAMLGRPVAPPYSLVDMADDVAGLLDALELDAAHLVGCSLGGMIAQTFAITHPHRIRSLTSIMASPGGLRFMLSRPSAVRELLTPSPRTADEAQEGLLRYVSKVGSPRFPPDEAGVRRAALRAFERCSDTRGFTRQLAAMVGSGSRAEALRFVRTPTTVLHGAADPLILPFAGRATARAIPAARLRIIEGMGHDLPPGVWPILVEEIVAVARRARRPRHARENATGFAPRGLALVNGVGQLHT